MQKNRNYKDLLFEYKNRNKSLLAFNLQNFYQLEAAKIAAEKNELPVIIQFSERYLKFLDEKYGLAFILKKYSSPYIFFHLDHCKNLPLIKDCISKGFDSVMYDGSSEPLEVNIKNTREVMEYAQKFGCLVEGELGEIAGVEDGFGHEGSSYAEVSEAVQYVKETNIDLLALGIGNAHGFYNSLDSINTEILEKTSELLDNQLFVLHGGTGLPDEIVSKAINLGVVKINVSTFLKKTTTDLLRDYLQENELFNEIKFHDTQVNGLIQVFESFILKYTK